MAFSKAHRFDEDVFLFSQIADALAPPARVTIVRKLLDHDESSVKELREGVELSRNAFSQHLRILREKQLVRFKEAYPTVYYRLNEDLPLARVVLEQFIGILDSLKKAHLLSRELKQIAHRHLVNIGQQSGDN